MLKISVGLYFTFSIIFGQSYQAETFTRNTKIVFADSLLAVEVVTADDDYTRLVSAYERSAGMKTAKPVSSEDYRTHLAKNVKKWDKKEVKIFSSFIKKAAADLQEYSLNLPEEIILIKTTSQEFGGVNTAYTRQNAIMFTDKILSSKKLYNTFLHEIFHVFSRHNPEIRNKLYAIIGFRQSNEIQLPKEWYERRITNPDAPALNTIIDLKIGNEIKTLTPLIYASNTLYDTAKAGGIFQSMLFRLMLVEEKNGLWQVVFSEGNPVLYKPSELEDYWNKIGKNTNYIIHPEEIMASNFELLITEKKDLANPEIIEKFKQVLTK